MAQRAWRCGRGWVLGVWSGLVGGAVSYELGEVAPGIVGVAKLVLQTMLMGGARMNCATRSGRRPGFQGSLCLVDKATPRGWYFISWVEPCLVGGGMSHGPGRKEGGWVYVERTWKPWEAVREGRQGSGISAGEAKIRLNVGELRKG